MKQQTIDASLIYVHNNTYALPMELLGEILNFLPLQELAQAFKVSKKFRTAVTTLETPSWNSASVLNSGNTKIQNYKQFVLQVRQESNGLLQALSFRLRDALYLAHCPFTKFSAVADTEDVAVQHLFDMFKLAQLLPENQDIDDMTQMYDINLTPSRGKIQEAVFADANDQFVSTFVIEYPTLRGIKGQQNTSNMSARGNNNNNAIMAVNLKVLPLAGPQQAVLEPLSTIVPSKLVEYVEAFAPEVSTLEREVISKSLQTNLAARNATFVCWEKCSFGTIHCTDVYKTTPNSTKISVAMFKKGSQNAMDQQLWSCIEESKEKRFEYWFSPSSPLSA